MIERIVGRFGGSDLSIVAPRGDGRRTCNRGHGDCMYNASALSNRVRPWWPALLAALESVGKHHADAQTQLETHKRLEDLRLELARSLEHEGRLTDLLVRQRRLPKQLDLDRDEAGSAKVDADEGGKRQLISPHGRKAVGVLTSH
ncbi:MAG: hypothetical protein IPL15_24835 [Comamonadaceae bacterium]|uniref:hypothetical protein n=1 Tax=Candidatus Skiveiella danica TaxID=3386177 RepID=UPI00390B4689|nr:hypothetical protein [Comamonadaceae bacterium]